MGEKVINIARNTSYYTMALILQKVISFSYFIIIARALGPEDLGKYYFAISFTTIFSILIDLGLANVLTREVAKDQTDAQHQLSTVFSLKLPFTILTGLIVFGVAQIMHYSELTKTLIYISSASMVLDSFTLTFFSIMRGFHNLKYESIASVLFQLVVLISGLLSLTLHWGIIWLVAALAFASGFNFIFSLLVVTLAGKMRLKIAFDKVLIKKLAKITLPFALFAIFQRIYTYIDSIMLADLSGDRSVGIYQVAFKIINALQFLPMAFSASLYPAFATYWHNNRLQLAVTFERAINYLLIISLPIGIGIFVVADKIVALFSHGYTDAILPLQITIASLVFVFLNFAVGALLNACDKQVVNTVIVFIGTVVCVVMNWLIIPKFGATGATITDATTNTLILLLGLFFIPSIIKYNYRKLAINTFKILAASLVMGLIAFNLKQSLNIFIVMGLSAVVYAILLYVLKVVKKQDLQSIIASFSKKPAEETIE